jgi:hypothetical protein
MNDADTIEIELSRRLADLATTTRVADDAWERITARAGEPEGRRPGGGMSRPPRRLLLAAAAAAVVVGAAVVLVQGANGDVDDLRTDDRDRSGPATTGGSGDDHRSRDGATSATGATPSADGDRAGPTPGDSPSPGGAGEGPGADPEATTPGGGAGGGSGAEPPAPPRVSPTMTLATADYTVEVIVAEFDMFLRRTDGVGNSTVGPDAYGARQQSGWGVVGGSTCLASGGGEFSFAGAAPHAFTYGLAGSAVQRVEVVMADGQRASAAIGPVATSTGLRAWLVERPLGTVDRIEGLDGTGQVAATVTDLAAGADDFGLGTGC